MGLIIPAGIDAIRLTYGDARAALDHDGEMSPALEVAWRKKILAPLKLPRPIPLRTGKTLSTIWVHAKVAQVFGAAFRAIDDAGHWPLLVTFDGCYAFRAKRGLDKLSTHCWGIAVDLNAATNRLGATPTIRSEIVAAFEVQGCRWGGRWRRPDGMHFQACTGY